MYDRFRLRQASGAKIGYRFISEAVSKSLTWLHFVGYDLIGYDLNILIGVFTPR